MKKVIILSTSALVLAFGACKNSSTKSEATDSAGAVQAFNLDTTKIKSGDTFYQCEMDPSVILDKPGKCPKCGMDLEKTVKK